MDKFKQAFQEEAQELLQELESTLLELEERPDETELVGRAFRALHTIKGSGAMVGFSELSAFTHNIETAFDEVRSGRRQATPDLIGVSLAATDQIKTMLDEAAGVGSADPHRAAEILAKLRELTGASPHQTAEPMASAPVIAAQTEDGVTRDWQIHFSPGPDLLRNGTNPLLLLRELRELGNLRVTADTVAVPPLAELEPGRCYLAWDMVLSTQSPLDAIRDVFIFVEGNCELSIEPAPAVEEKGQLTTDAASVVEEKGKLPTQPAAGASPDASVPAPPRTDRRSTGGRRASDQPDTASSIRVAATKLDQLINLVGELVTVQARLSALAARRDDPDMLTVSEEVERLTAALRDNSMSIRMLPIRATFERFRRLVHDLAHDLHKDVELTIEGADTELDKTVIDQLHDPLMHLIRNSMDHGVETPEGRLAAGKTPTASIHLSARHAGANVLIGVSDDGAGINAAAVRARAIERGLVTPDAQLSEAETFSLIMAPGFSTAAQVTDISGRGVGMDVVRRSIETLRGTIEIASTPGAGTAVTLRLPLTLAIIDGLLVRVRETYFVLPVANTLECVELTRQDVERANGKHIANLRGELVPYLRLSEYFHMSAERAEREQIMIAETEQGRFGFVVDEVLGDHQTVIKNLGRVYRNVHVVSGATILGDGSVALILDPNRLVQDAIRTLSTDRRSDAHPHQRRPEGAAA